MRIKLEIMTKWLKYSGIIVNETRTDLCLFYNAHHNPIEITINNLTVRSKNSINVLGIQFDSQLKCDQQVSQAIKKSKKSHNQTHKEAL
jgi:hypothetical protein